MKLKGSEPYVTNAESGVGTLTVVVKCTLTGSPEQHRGFFDTGAQWSILPGDIAEMVGIYLTSDGLGRAALHTRLGRIQGFFERLPFTLLARGWREPHGWSNVVRVERVV